VSFSSQTTLLDKAFVVLTLILNALVLLVLGAIIFPNSILFTIMRCVCSLFVTLSLFGRIFSVEIRAHAVGPFHRSAKAESTPYEDAKSDQVILSTKDLTSSSKTLSAKTNATPDPKIIGGRDAKPGKYPWMVNGAGCGGTLVWYDIVLTAAHCYGYLNNPRLRGVLVGNTQRGTLDAGAEKRSVIIQIPHPQYDDRTHQWDFMIAVLDSPVTSPQIQPIQLNNDSSVPASNEKVVALGFGRTKEDGPIPKTLQQVKMFSVSAGKCRKTYRNHLFPETMVCAYRAHMKGVCNGDSGGPLLYKGKQVGIVSWGLETCAKDPAVFTRVSAGYDWILAQVCGYSKRPPDYCATRECYSANTTRLSFTPLP